MEKRILEFLKINYNSNGLIVDVGTNRGKWTKQCQIHFQNNKYIQFEANPVLYTQLVKQKTDNITVLNKIVSYKEDDTIFILPPKHDGLSSTTYRPVFDTLNQHINEISVDCYQIDTIEEGIFFLKIDTEGGEFNVLKSAENKLKNKEIDFIQFECGETFTDSNYTLQQVVDYLDQYDYTVYDFKQPKIKKLIDCNNYEFNNFLATYKTIL